ETLAQALATGPSIVGVLLTGNQESGDAVLPRKAGIVNAGDDSRPFLLSYQGAVRPLSIYEQSATGLGRLNIQADSDGPVRRLPLMLRYRDQILPSFTAEALRVALGGTTYVLKASGANNVYETTELGLSQIKIGRSDSNTLVPTESNGSIIL